MGKGSQVEWLPFSFAAIGAGFASFEHFPAFGKNLIAYKRQEEQVLLPSAFITIL